MNKSAEDFRSRDGVERDSPSPIGGATRSATPPRGREIRAVRFARPRGAAEGKWPRRRTLALLLVTCGGFWLALALLLRALA
jgi:hypothetical protein